jgi:hypothetical protein
LLQSEILEIKNEKKRTKGKSKVKQNQPRNCENKSQKVPLLALKQMKDNLAEKCAGSGIRKRIITHPIPDPE